MPRGTYCAICKERHPLSRARGAVAATCMGCDARTTDIRTIPIQQVIDGAMAIGLALLCTPCSRRGVQIPQERIFGPATDRLG